MNKRTLQALGVIATVLDQQRSDLEALTNDELEAYDSLSEKAQQSDRGGAMSIACDTLETAVSSLADVVEILNGLSPA